MMIYVFGSILVAVVIIAFLFPSLRRKKNLVSRTASAGAMLQDQLSEVDRDIARGLISVDEGRSARVEIQRRIIAVDRDRSSSIEATETGTWAMIAASIIVPLAAVLLYLNIGSPTVPSAIFSERVEEIASVDERVELTTRLRARLEADANGGPSEGWVLLAEAYMRMGQYSDSADAYSRILERDEATFTEFSRFAEALILRENGLVTPLAERALDRSLVLEPGNPAAIYYKSFALEQSGESDAAYELLTSRLASANGFYPWMASFVDQANFYGESLGKAPILLDDYAPVLRGPTAEDIAGAAEMSNEDRNDFIASMVARLASRLEDEPNDLDGWIRLGGAYVVLGDTASAISAYQNAQGLLVDIPETDQRRQAITKAIADLAP